MFGAAARDEVSKKDFFNFMNDLQLQLSSSDPSSPYLDQFITNLNGFAKVAND